MTRKQDRHPSIQHLDMRKPENHPSWWPILERPPDEVRSMALDEWKEKTDRELYQLMTRYHKEVEKLSNIRPRTKEVRADLVRASNNWRLLGDYVTVRRSDRMGMKW